MQIGRAWTVRQATFGDRDRLSRLVGEAQRVMLRFRSDRLAVYLTEEPFLLLEEAGRLKGFLVCLARRPPLAALAAAGLSDDVAVSSWLDHLLTPCIAHLRAGGTTALTYTGSAAWLTGPLQGRGFQLISHIVTFEKANLSIPHEGNQTVDVRPVESADMPALVALDALVFHPRWRNSVDTLTRWKEVVPFFVVGVVEESVVGCCCCSVIEPGHGYLIRMAVHPSWQGRGVGTRLVAETVRFFGRAGARRITLNTQEENERAQRLYRKFGFRLMGREATALWRKLQ